MEFREQKGTRALNQQKFKHMNIENTASQMRKGVLEFCVLSVIRQGEAYPSDIIETMKGFDLLTKGVARRLRQSPSS